MTTVDFALHSPNPHAPNERPGNRVVPIRLDAGLAAALRDVARTTGAGLDAVLLAGYQVLLARLDGRRDVAVVTRLPGTASAFAVRTDLGGTPGFRKVVEQVATTLLEASTHAGALDALVDDLRAVPNPGPPDVDAVFELLPATPKADDLTAHDALAAVGAPLWLTLHDGPQAISGELRHLSERVDPEATQRIATMFAHLLGELAAAPDRDVRSLPPMPPAERERILYALNQYHTPHTANATMAQPFEEQVRRTPDATALVSDRGQLTYTELNTSANRLAWELRSLGARPGTFVAVSMPRSLELMVALYAVAKSGAAYVPIDPDLPDSRMGFMLEDSAPVAVLADARTQPRIPCGPWKVLAVDADASRWDGRPEHNLPSESCNHLIHLLYTSGTTGRPKAVAYPVDGALADIAWLHRSYPYGPGDTALFKTSYGFDVSIWEIFWPLFHGARIAICPPDAHRDPGALRDAIDRYRVTTMFMVPSMMPPFYACTPPGSCPSLRWVFCGGEAVTPRVRDGFHERFAGQIINCYGPTELGCVAETVLPVEPGAPVPVGPPVEHRRAYVLDDSLQPMPIDVTGELYVGGEVGIAQGYHRRPTLTAERFPADPFGPPGGRMYRTGDLARYRSDGVIEHLGRIGRQVKIRGIRIELAEIEAVLSEHPNVAQCVVSVVPGSDGEIAAFAVPASGTVLSAADLVAHARRMLPAHMVPATGTVVEAIPTFVNGKIDVEQLLPLIDRSGPSDLTPFDAPATVTEERVTALFSQILQVDVVSATGGFFELGGHSLLVFRLVEACAAMFGVELAVREVLRALTPRALAKLIDEHPDRATTQ